MSAARLLFDTNAYSAWAAGDAAVRPQVERAREILMSAIVVGELLYGFHRGSRTDDDVRRLEAFLAQGVVTFVPVTVDTCDRYGRVMASLRARGRPIPSNDVWIAAHVLETGATLLSRDRHFEHVEGLVLQAF